MALPVLQTAGAAGFVVQFRWALHHGFWSFPWRWAATAAAVFLVLSPLLVVPRLLSDPTRARYEAGLRCLPVLGLLPLAVFVWDPRNRAAIVVFVIALFLFLWRQSDRADARAGAVRWSLRALAAVALLYAAAAPVPVDGVTLHIAAPNGGDYFWASREPPPPDARWGPYGTYRSKPSGRDFSVPVDIPPVRDPGDTLRVGLGALAEQTELRRMSFDSSLLAWNFPLATLSGGELLDRGMVPVHTELTRHGGSVSVRPLGSRGSEVEIPRAAIVPALHDNGLRMWGFRGLWVLVMAVVLLAARLAASLDRRAWLWPWVGLRAALFRVPETASSTPRTHVRERIGWIAAGVALLLGLLFYRSGANILNPGLYVEDANFCFDYFYGGEKPLTDSFIKLNKYISLVYSLAWLAAFADVQWQPTLYVWSTLLVTLTAASLPSFSGLLRDRLTLLFAPAVLGLSGIVHVFLWVTLVYQMHVTVLALIVLLLFPPPETRIGAAVQALAIAYFTWAAPFSVVAVPLATLLLILRLYPGGRKIAMLIYAMVCAFLYYLTLQGGTTKPFALLSSPEMQEHFFVLLVEKVLLLDVFGPYTHGKFLAVVAFVAAITYRLRRDVLYLKVSVALWLTMLAGHAVYFMTDKYDPYLHLPHYLQVSLFCWWLYLVITVDRAVAGFSLPRPAALAAWSLVLAVVVYDNTTHPDKGAYPLHASIPEFLKTVKQYELQREELIARHETVYVWTPGMFAKQAVDDRDWSPHARIGSRAPDAKVTEVFIPLVMPAVR